MNELNWLAVLKAYRKLKLIASDAIFFNTSSFAKVLKKINELGVNKLKQKSHTIKLI